ncbi:MAG: DUF1643 domain-containing protein [Pseudomonadota bacterium]
MAFELGTHVTAAGASYSRCGAYRYRLWRRWSDSGTCLFLMLNPSTADARINDPTISRCQSFAERWGFGGLLVCNLFAFRATDPAVLLRAAAPIGAANNRAINESAARAQQIVCAWGNHGAHQNRAENVVAMLQRRNRVLHVLNINRSGQPAHPLYQRADTTPSVWCSSGTT